MDMRRLCELVETAARASDPEMAGRIVVGYIAPDELHVFRVGCGLHHFGGGAASFATAFRNALAKLWPESTQSTRETLGVIAHAVGKLMAGRARELG